MAVNNSLEKQPQKIGLTAYLTQDAVKNQINSVVGGKNGTRFISSIISAVQATPALQECTNSSILSAALLGESLNLSPSPQLGQFYLVPYDNKRKGAKEAQFQLGYKGYIQLAIRSSQYKKLNVLAIKEGELIKFDPMNEEIEVSLIEDEWLRDEAPTIGYYAMFEYTNGFKKAIYWSKRKMLAHADHYSKAFHVNAVESSYPNACRVSYDDFLAGKYPDKEAWKYSSYWYTDFDGMAYKTMLRQLISKWGIMSIDMIQAIDSDMAVIRDDGTKEYVDIESPEIYDNAIPENQVTEGEPDTLPDDSTVQETSGQSAEDDFFN